MTEGIDRLRDSNEFPPLQADDVRGNARGEIDNLNLEFEPAALDNAPVPPGTLRAFFRSINDRLDKIHPAAKYVVWTVVGLAVTTTIVCTVIYAGGFQDAVVKGLKEFFDINKIWKPIVKSVAIGGFALAVIGMVSSPDTYRGGELGELAIMASVGFGIATIYGAGMAYGFSRSQ